MKRLLPMAALICASFVSVAHVSAQVRARTMPPKNWSDLKNSVLHSGTPFYDVTAFGAHCDAQNTGLINGTDDTSAFSNAVAAAIAGGGMVYIPRPILAGRACRVNLSAFYNPTKFTEWLYVIDEAPLLTTGSISGTRLVAIIGQQGFFQTGGGDFAAKPAVGWAGQTAADSALLITSSSSLYFKGINFAPANHGSFSAPTVYIHDSGPSSGTVNVTFDGDAFSSYDCAHNHNVNITNTATLGSDFNIGFTGGSQFGCADPGGNALYLEGVVEITLGDSSVASNFEGGGVYINNNGGSPGFYTGGIYTNVLFESVDHALFTVGSTNQLVGLWLDNVSDADPTATPSIVKTVSNDLRDLEVRGTVFASPGSGGQFFDPASSGSIFGFVCIGAGGCFNGMTAGSATLSGLIMPPGLGHNSGESIVIQSQAEQYPALVVRGVGVNLAPQVFASYPNCALELDGTSVTVTDSTTSVWGEVISGGGTNRVQAYCDGANWTVSGK
jgi:hypothetical protein